MFKKNLFLVLIGIVTIQFVSSQEINFNKLNRYFEALESLDKFMGSVAILKEGKLVYTKQIGFSDIETKQKPDNNTKYRIGSISKTFTATLVFKAIEDHKLTLEKTLDTYFPTIPNAEKITISNLLNHRSGIHNFTNDPDYLNYYTLSKTEGEMIALLAKKGSDFDPNTKAAYSNSNYVLLSYILQKVYHKPFDTLLNDFIVNPLRLKNTHLGQAINITANECYSYNFLKEWKKQPETNMSIPMGAGAIVSTPTDLVMFANALFSNQIISEKSLQKMTTLQDGYGMGVFTMNFHEKLCYRHNGGIDGFRSYFAYFPNEKYGFAITSNGMTIEANKVNITIASALLNKSYEIPSFKKHKVTSKKLDAYLGVYYSLKFPLKITVTKSNATLIAQATGQSPFRLEAYEKHVFKFDAAGIVLKFNPTKNELILEQGGGHFLFKKEL